MAIDSEELSTLLNIIHGLVNAGAGGEECSLDHHGYCQTHMLSDPPCVVKVAKELLQKYGINGKIPAEEWESNPVRGMGEQPL